MRYLLGLFLLIPCAASAQQGIQNVHEVALSTSSITQTISIGTTALDVAATTSSGTVSGAFAIEVYNVAGSSQTINCGFDQAVSTSKASVWYGREVPPGVGVTWQKQSGRKLWCVAPFFTVATITQMK